MEDCSEDGAKANNDQKNMPPGYSGLVTQEKANRCPEDGGYQMLNDTIDKRVPKIPWRVNIIAIGSGLGLPEPGQTSQQ